LFNLFPIGVLVVILGVLSGLDPGEDAGPVLLGSDDGPGDVGPVLPGLDSPDGPGDVGPVLPGLDSPDGPGDVGPVLPGLDSPDGPGDVGPVLPGLDPPDDGPGDVGPVLPGLDSPDDGPGEVSPREDCAGLLCGGVEEGPLPGAVVPAVVIWTVGTEKAAVTTAAVGLPALDRSVLA